MMLDVLAPDAGQPTYFQQLFLEVLPDGGARRVEIPGSLQFYVTYADADRVSCGGLGGRPTLFLPDAGVRQLGAQRGQCLGLAGSYWLGFYPGQILVGRTDGPDAPLRNWFPEVTRDGSLVGIDRFGSVYMYRLDVDGGFYEAVAYRLNIDGGTERFRGVGSSQEVRVAAVASQGVAAGYLYGPALPPTHLAVWTDPASPRAIRVTGRTASVSVSVVGAAGEVCGDLASNEVFLYSPTFGFVFSSDLGFVSEVRCVGIPGRNRFVLETKPWLPFEMHVLHVESE
jgi:hypothetical protein